MNCVVQNAHPEQRFQRPPIDDVGGTFKDFVDVQFHPGVLENAHRPVLIEIHQHVNIAVWVGFAPCHRTEYCGVRNAKPPQFGLVGAKCVENRL